MTIVAHELKASYAFIERNFFLTRRYWGWELAFLVYSVAGALSISLIGADQGSPTLLLTLIPTPIQARQQPPMSHTAGAVASHEPSPHALPAIGRGSDSDPDQPQQFGVR